MQLRSKALQARIGILTDRFTVVNVKGRHSGLEEKPDKRQGPEPALRARYNGL